MDANIENRKPFATQLNVLHRLVVVLLIGLTVLYGISGLSIAFKDSDFLKISSHIETKIPPLLSPADIGKKLGLKRMQVTKIAGDEISFKDGENVPTGTYNAATGDLKYEGKKVPALLNLFTIEKTGLARDIAVLYSVLLVFLGGSFLYTSTANPSRRTRGIVFSLLGIVLLGAALFG